MGRGPDEPVFVLAPAAGDCHRAARLVDSSHGDRGPTFLMTCLCMPQAGWLASCLMAAGMLFLPSARPRGGMFIWGSAQPTTASRVGL